MFRTLTALLFACLLSPVMADQRAETQQQLDAAQKDVAELKKLLAAPDPAPSLAAMPARGVLTRLLPGADARAMALLVHLEEGIAPHWPRRLALLIPGLVVSGLAGETSLRSALRLSRVEAGEMTRLRHAVSEGGAPARLGYQLGAATARDAILVRAALLEAAPAPGWDQDLARGAAAVFLAVE